MFVRYQLSRHGRNNLGRMWLSACSMERGEPWMGHPSCRGSGGILSSRPNLEVEFEQ